MSEEEVQNIAQQAAERALEKHSKAVKSHFDEEERKNLHSFAGSTTPAGAAALGRFGILLDNATMFVGKAVLIGIGLFFLILFTKMSFPEALKFLSGK